MPALPHRASAQALPPHARLAADREYLERVLSQFKRLYIRLRRRWIEQTPAGTYVHHEVSGPSGRERGWLTDQILRDHLLGRRVVGVFHRPTTSVFSFDLDFQTDDETIRTNLTRAFLQWLEELLGPGCCHVWNTGSKGYRVEIFLTEPVEWPRLSAFFSLVLDTPWYEDAPDDLRYTWRSSPYLRIETRPESPAGGRGVKLPLCVDRRNGRFCTFLDPRTLEPVPDPYEYLLRIAPIHPSVLPTAHTPAREHPHPLSVPTSPAAAEHTPEHAVLDELHTLPAAQLVAKCERLWREGLTAPGTRHAALLLLARWHRWRKPDLQLHELESLLLSWTERELRYRRHLIAHDRRHCLRDARSVALSAIRGRYSLATYLRRAPSLTQADIAALNSIRSADQRLVFLALLLHRSLYASPTGEFFASYAQIADLLGWTLPTDQPDTSLPDKPRVGRAIRSLLRTYPHLIIKVKPADQPRRLATHYRITLPMPDACAPHTVIPWPYPLTTGSVTLDALASLTTVEPAATLPDGCHPLAFPSRLSGPRSIENGSSVRNRASDVQLMSERLLSPSEEEGEEGRLGGAACLSPVPLPRRTARVRCVKLLRAAAGNVLRRATVLPAPCDALRNAVRTREKQLRRWVRPPPRAMPRDD